MLQCFKIAQKSNEHIVSYFDYGLSLSPATLFCNDFMRHSDKYELAEVLLKNVPSITHDQLRKCGEVMTLIDGGWLVS